MRARRLLPLLLVLATVAVGATGCFSSKVADTTISGEITIGQGTAAETVNPATAAGSETTGATRDDEHRRDRPARPRPTTETETTTGGGSGADVAAGKTAFVATCGGCHALKDAGTNGSVGPDIDSARTALGRRGRQADRGRRRRRCLPKLLEGQDAANVAAYVASVAGK